MARRRDARARARRDGGASMMSRRASSVGAWLELLRVANAPTLASNAIAGAAVGLHALPPGSAVPAGSLALAGSGLLFIYLAGMVLNDAFDARTDSTERPGRPIPSGRVTVARAVTVGLVMLGVGGAMAGSASGPTWPILLCALVLLYDLMHGFLPGAFLLMAGCRACVPVVAALAVCRAPGGESLGWVAGGLAAYVACVSLAARDEVRGFGTSARLGARLVPLAALFPLGMWAFGSSSASGWSLWLGLTASGLASVAALLALRASRRGAARFAVPAAVGAWIGTIPLLDASACFLLDRPGLGACCVGLWAFARVLRPVFAAS